MVGIQYVLTSLEQLSSPAVCDAEDERLYDYIARLTSSLGTFHSNNPQTLCITVYVSKRHPMFKSPDRNI